MKYVKLGNSDLKVSKVCMGCMGFGNPENGMHTWTLNEEKSREIIKYGIDNGINFFDTAIGYQNGSSEQYLGRCINDYCNREDVIIATKFLPRSQNDIDNNISGQEHISRWPRRVWITWAWTILTCISITCGILTRPYLMYLTN